MTQFTWNRGLGVPGPYNDSDFTTAYTGAAVGQWTWNRGLGFAGPWNDSDFTTDPGTPGGDYLEVSSDIDAGVSITIAEITGIDVVCEAYCGIEATVTSDALLFTQSDVDYARVEWLPFHVLRIEEI